MTGALEKNLNTNSSTVFFTEYKKDEDSLNEESLYHFHVHIIPRMANDFNNKDDIFKYLAEHDKE